MGSICFPRCRGLGQDAAESEVGGVRLDGQRLVWLEVLEDGSSRERQLLGPLL